MAPVEGVPDEAVEAFVLAAHGNLARVKELHRRHPEVLNARYAKFDETALEAAGHMGRRDIVAYLLDAGAPLTIFAAAMLGRTDRVAEFLDRDPSLAGAKGVHGLPLLFHAALSGEIALADLLVARGGGDGAGLALHAAVRPGRVPGHVEMVRWLLARGADSETPNFEGKTPLQVAVETGQPEIADLLRRHGASDNPAGAGAMAGAGN
jgi:ankyrin repeat protein